MTPSHPTGLPACRVVSISFEVGLDSSNYPTPPARSPACFPQPTGREARRGALVFNVHGSGFKP
jgi:hypothetical protein